MRTRTKKVSCRIERVFVGTRRGIAGAGVLGVFGLMGAVGALAGCAGDRSGRAPAQSLHVNDFRSAAAPTPQPASGPQSTVVLDRTLGFSPQRGNAGALEVVARAGAPAMPDSPRVVAAPVVVDQKVGEINTRPVWAAEFLSPMAARMRQRAEEEPPALWRTRSRDRIVEELTLRLNQELVRADTFARIPPDRRQGLGYVIEDVFRRERSAQRGSEALIERNLREQNSTLGEAWQTQRDKLLIDLRVREWVEQVHVSADEVDLEYERRYAEFNPDPRAIFRRIRVDAREQEAIARIQQRLEGGEPFAEVAADPANRNNPEGGGLVTNVGAFTGEYSEATFWAASATELNTAARSLSEGKWTGPFEVGPSVNWLQLEGIEHNVLELYEARPLIRRQLEDARFNEIQNADFDAMKSRASYTDINEMTNRLLNIAERWYLEPVLQRTRQPAVGERPVRPQQ